MIPFLAFVLAGTFTPGPNNIMAMNSARSKGFWPSYPFLAGMAFGFGLVIFMAAIFNLYLTRIMPRIQPFLGVLGALYMLWLAAKPFIPHKNGDVFAPGESMPFLTGMLLQLVNPKVIFYALAIMASFILPHYGSMPAVFAISAALGFVGFVSVNCWALFGVLFQRYLSAHETALNVLMALLLVYCAYSVSGLDVRTWAG